MEKSAFIAALKAARVSYEERDGKLIVNGGAVDLSSLTTLPENVQFANGGDVYLRSLTTLPENVQFANGDDVYLSSLTTLPENVQFANGGAVYLSSLTTLPENAGHRPYVERFQVALSPDGRIVYKRVSQKWQTREGIDHETLWVPGSTLVHPAWDPQLGECGAGKFHACAHARWCDAFRSLRSDRYVAIAVQEDDLFEWTLSPSYPQKIGFRRGVVLYECDRQGNRIDGLG